MAEAFDVSVIIPLFNKAPFISRTLECVLAQTHPAAEIIIVDDGSTDGSAEVVADLIGGPVRLIQQANAGPGPARNRGVAAASNDWIAFIDADDRWARDHLQTLARLQTGFPEAVLLATAFKRAQFDEPTAVPDILGDERSSLFDYFVQDSSEGGLSSSSVAVRRSACQAAGGFGDEFPGEDFVLWIRLALDHQIARTTHVTAFYTQGTGGIMERLERQPIGFKLNPIFPVLEAALSDERYTSKHASIRALIARWLLINVRQALYRGEPHVARAFIRMLDQSGHGRVSGGLRILARFPGWTLRSGMKIRARFRRNEATARARQS